MITNIIITLYEFNSKIERQFIFFYRQFIYIYIYFFLVSVRCQQE